MTISKLAVLALVLSVQNAPVETGIITGVVTRPDTREPLPDVQLTLEGGAVDPKVMQLILNSAAGAGIVVSPPPGASLSEITRLMTTDAAARSLPVRDATIQQMVNNAAGGNTWPSVTTDRDGRFTFKDVRPGKYTVRAQRDGYFGKAVNGVYPATASMDVAVEGREAAEASLAMVRGAIIGGRVYDISGQALTNVNVQVFTVTYQNGFSVLQPIVAKVSDDRGEYRLFWIPPGDYYVGVTPRTSPATATGLQAAKTFYPGVTRIGDATPVKIRGGEDLTGIDIGIRATPAFRITGEVHSFVPPTEAAAAAPVVTGAVLMLVTRDVDTPDDSTGQNRVVGNAPLTPTMGKFEVSNIQPGAYDLFARIPDPGSRGQYQGVAWGRAAVDVRDSDVAGVTITINRSVDVKGTVSLSANARIPSNVRIVLLPDAGGAKIPMYQLVATRATAIGADGSFSITGIPEGRFRLGALAGLPPDLYIADVRRTAQSVFDSGFDVSVKNTDPIEVVVSSGAGTVSGSVMDGPLKPFGGATVVLVPEQKRRQNRALFLSTTADASGRFGIRGVVPGDYKLFAWETLATNAFLNASFLAAFEERGRSIHVAQGGTVEMEVAVIPAVQTK
jgi:hypothetical protein